MMLTISTRFSFSFFFLRGLYIILLLFQGFNHAKTKTINFNHFEVCYFYKSTMKNNILILFFSITVVGPIISSHGGICL